MDCVPFARRPSVNCVPMSVSSELSRVAEALRSQGAALESGAGGAGAVALIQAADSLEALHALAERRERMASEIKEQFSSVSAAMAKLKSTSVVRKLMAGAIGEGENTHKSANNSTSGDAATWKRRAERCREVAERSKRLLKESAEEIERLRAHAAALE